jgi:hypothetical protein
VAQVRVGEWGGGGEGELTLNCTASTLRADALILSAGYNAVLGIVSREGGIPTVERHVGEDVVEDDIAQD